MNNTQARRCEKIQETIREIPCGRVASYGQIAKIAGVPRGARQVGFALRQLPPRHGVPWYRVVQVSGTIAFEKGSGGLNLLCYSEWPLFRAGVLLLGIGAVSVVGQAGVGCRADL